MYEIEPQFVKIQKHCINDSYLVTIPNSIAKAISISKGDVMKTIIDSNKRVVMEKV